MYSPRGNSLKAAREYQQLMQMRRTLNQQMTVTSSAPFPVLTSDHRDARLPTLCQQKMRLKYDRYASQTEKYENNLRGILSDIKKKIEVGQSQGFSYFSRRCPVKPKQHCETVRASLKEDLKVRTISLLSKDQATIEPSLSTVVPGPIAVAGKTRTKGSIYRSSLQKYSFEPWSTIEQLEMHTMQKL